jgi:hypothetical protein
MKAKMKTLFALLASLTLAFTATAKDKVPSGFMELEDLTKAQEKAKQTKKLIAIVAKGADDNCPKCAAALTGGKSAFGSDCVLVFTRSEGLPSATIPDGVKKGMSGSPTGAAVTYVVFNQDLTEVVTRIGRDEINGDKTKVKDSKKAVSEARKKLLAAK